MKIKMKKELKYLLFGLVFIACIFIYFGGFVLVWNYVMPLFGLTKLTILQAIALNFVFKILVRNRNENRPKFREKFKEVFQEFSEKIDNFPN